MSAIDLHQAVLEFQSDVTFPRFSMKRGERWGFAVYGKQADWLDRIACGQRFDFAGGQCLAEDVLLVYLGPADMDYSYAAGYVRPDFCGRAPGSMHLTSLTAPGCSAICGAGVVEERSDRIDVSCAALRYVDVISRVCPACLVSYSASRPADERVPVWLQDWRARQSLATPMPEPNKTPDADAHENHAGAADLEAAGHRLALELECLLMDCKDLPTVSKWFDSAHEALAQWQALTQQAHVSPLGMP